MLPINGAVPISAICVRMFDVIFTCWPLDSVTVT